MEIQRTDLGKYAVLPISDSVRWAVWKPMGRRTVVTVYAPGTIVPQSDQRTTRLCAHDTLLIDAQNEQISVWVNL